MAVPLRRVLEVLEDVAPLELAEDWDNVGLLVEPPAPRRVRRALLTIDLTAAVMAEAEAAKVELIVAYHPPIFAPLRRIVCSDPKAALVARCLARRIAVYSPHTALDAAPGGVNDWLADGLGRGTRSSLQPAMGRRPFGYRLTLRVAASAAERAQRELRDSGVSVDIASADGDTALLTGGVPAAAVARVHAVLAARELADRADLVELASWKRSDSGQGRLLELARPVAVASLVRRLKRHLGLRHLRAALAPSHRNGEPVARVALCAGAGGSVVGGVPADVYVTGEMRHHDVLAALERETSVLLCEHTNTERGYLAVLRDRLDAELRGSVEWSCAVRDAEPLDTV